VCPNRIRADPICIVTNFGSVGYGLRPK